MFLNTVLSIKKCQEVLNKKENKYTEKEVIKIREYLYQMALVMDELKSGDNE